MILKFLSFIIICFSIGFASGQCEKKCNCSKENKPCNETSIKLSEILKISKKLDSLLTSNLSDKFTNLDTTAIAVLKQELKGKSDSIKNLSLEVSEKDSKIKELDIKEKKTQETLISNLKKSSKINSTSFLELYMNTQESQNSDLKEFQLLYNLLEECDNLLKKGFTNKKTVNDNVDLLKSKGPNYKVYPGLNERYNSIRELMNNYIFKSEELNNHFIRYYETFKIKNTDEEKIRRILYLQDFIIDFKDYPYLLELIFKAMDNPDGTNQLKAKLK
jgi:hypothetical protein